MVLIDQVCDACGEIVRPLQYNEKYKAYLCNAHFNHANTGDMLSARAIILHNNDQIDTNSAGGKQSHLEYAFEEIEPEFIKAVAHVLWQGKEKYGSKNWRNIPHDIHLGRAMYHIEQALEGTDHSEHHYANATCRIMFAMMTQPNTKKLADLIKEHM